MATFTNQATLSYNGSLLNSNTVTGEIVDILSAVKTAAPATYRIGDTITYVINLFNTGAADFTDASITDNLGTYVLGDITPVPLTYVTGSAAYYINGVRQGAVNVANTDPLNITGITVPAGGNATVIYQAMVNSAANPGVGGTITNIATVNATGIPAPFTASTQINANTGANLAITKSVSPTSVTDNGTLTYTFLIQNYGGTAVTTTENAVVTDTFNPVLTGLNVSFNGTPWALNTNYTYTNGAFETAANQISVPVAAYTQDPTTGQYTINPGTSTLIVSGTV